MSALCVAMRRLSIVVGKRTERGGGGEEGRRGGGEEGRRGGGEEGRRDSHRDSARNAEQQMVSVPCSGELAEARLSEVRKDRTAPSADGVLELFALVGKGLGGWTSTALFTELHP